MKRTPAVCFALFIIILTACSARTAIKSAPSAIAQAPAATFTPLAIAAATSTATQPPAPSKTPAPSLTPAMATTTPTVGYAQVCVTMEQELPADLGASGALLLYGGRYASEWNNTMFHFDLMSHRRSPVPYSALSLSLSPDGRWLAYIQQGYDELGRVKDRLLRVTDAEGRHLNLSYWGLNWQTLLGWLDAEHVLLQVPGFSGGDYISLNPLTGERTVTGENPLPEASAPAPEGETILSASPDGRFLAGWAQMDTSGSGYPFPNRLVLVDAESKQTTDLCFENRPPSDIGWVENSAPIWSPDGRFLALAISRVEERVNSRYTSEVLIWDTAIIDLQARRGYLLARDARPQAWMRKP